MLLKMKLSLCGPDLSLAPGDEHDFDEAEGQRLFDAGFADLACPVEVLVEETPEERVARLEAELFEARAALPSEEPQDEAPAPEAPKEETPAAPPATAPKKPAAKKA